MGCDLRDRKPAAGQMAEARSKRGKGQEKKEPPRPEGAGHGGFISGPRSKGGGDLGPGKSGYGGGRAVFLPDLRLVYCRCLGFGPCNVAIQGQKLTLELQIGNIGVKFAQSRDLAGRNWQAPCSACHTGRLRTGPRFSTGAQSCSLISNGKFSRFRLEDFRRFTKALLAKACRVRVRNTPGQLRRSEGAAVSLRQQSGPSTVDRAGSLERRLDLVPGPG